MSNKAKYDKAKNKKRQLRKLLLKKLIENVLKGKGGMIPKSEHDLVNTNDPRKTYYSPEERSSYNYGYMTVSEMGAGTPNIW